MQGPTGAAALDGLAGLRKVLGAAALTDRGGDALQVLGPLSLSLAWGQGCKGSAMHCTVTSLGTVYK